MRELYKGNIELTYDEYSDITTRLASNINSMSTIKKDCEIKGENEEIFYIKCIMKDSLYGIDLKLILTSKNNTIKKTNCFSEEFSRVSSIIGIKKISIKDKEGNNITFLINIDKVYDKVHYNDKTKFYISKLIILKEQMKTGFRTLLQNEICYRNFEDELDLVLATYCVFTGSHNLKKNIEELYLDKLYYVGIDVENKGSIIINKRSYNKLEIGEYDKILNIICFMTNKEKLLLYMINLISLIINNDVDRNKDKDYITDIGHKLVEKYIELYTLK